MVKETPDTEITRSRYNFIFFTIIKYKIYLIWHNKLCCIVSREVMSIKAKFQSKPKDYAIKNKVKVQSKLKGYAIKNITYSSYIFMYWGKSSDAEPIMYNLFLQNLWWNKIL